MRSMRKGTCLPSIWPLFFVAILAACGSDSSDGKTVAVKLSLIVDGRQVRDWSTTSRLFAWLERWIPGAPPALAQQVTEITRVNVQISGPGIPVPATADVPVTDPTSGQEIPVTIQAPVGPNRTITVAAFNAANAKIFGGTVPNVNLAAGAPIDVVVTLVRLFRVTVQKEGAGNGMVKSSPAGIDCGAICSAQFELGLSVVLNPEPAANSAFIGWSGGCTGTGPCTVNDNATVTARFEPSVTNHLSVNVNGPGTVRSSPPGISCPADCDENFPSGISVTLTAEPSNGSTFSGWSGGGCTGTGPCAVAMLVDQTVTASFTGVVPPQTSTLTVEVTGSGRVTSAPSGISCPGSCTASFARGDTVRLTADPAPDFRFVGWSGACGGMDPCTLVMDVDRTVSAQFEIVPVTVTLTVRNTGRGTGTVTDNTGAIVCGVACTATYLQGTVVTLTEAPDPGSAFNEWRGGPCNNQTTPQCVLTMDRDRTAEANFSAVDGGGG
jgi:List-Bact-rpt repeat protein